LTLAKLPVKKPASN
jgi:hypothetical protein